MEKFFKWFTAIFLIFHGGIFITVGLISKTVDSTGDSGNSSSIFLLFILVGLVTLSIGTVILIINIRKIKMIRDLKMSGIEIKAEITEFRRTNYRINRVPLYRVVAKDDNGNVFLSDARIQNKLEKRYEIGDEVTVLISLDDSKNYTVLLEM